MLYGLPEDKTGEWVDEICSLGKPNELIGRDHVLSRRLPANQRFEPHDGAVEIGLRLVANQEFAAIQSLAQFVHQGTLVAHPQPQEGVIYAPKIRREEGLLDWGRPAAELERRVRALDPWPGAYFENDGASVRVLAAAALAHAPGDPPGTVLDDRLAIACGSGVLRLLRLQRPGRAPLDASEFLRGYPIPPGKILPCPATS